MFNVAGVRRRLSVSWRSMSYVVLALLLYDPFWSLRFDGDWAALDGTVHRASLPVMARCSWMSGVPSRAESAVPTPGWLCLGHVDQSGSIVILSSSGGMALVDSGAAEALTAMQSGFNVDSTMTTH
ncbi:hypothetical protein B296_00027048 [Ensete ventricosum]|uniref:Uncharacterized protein n=1 Tax=Ensete ventricosum TaxID=4639 RepID=A0A426YUM2_ENSVE|nr:hypothetical protein B296_00027048 [Ensete ventricosum]